MIRIVEVAPRDGLQNEAVFVPTGTKARFVADLAAAGLQEIEVTSFVSPKWVPQLADAAELCAQVPEGVLWSALVPNAKGLERALEQGTKRIAVFTAASEAFTQKNINMSVDESILTFADVVREFRGAVSDGWVRAYLSTAFECPYSGKVDPKLPGRLALRLLDIGVDEVSIGDTTGVAVPKEVRAVIRSLGVERSRVAWHFHDTRGTAVANVQVALDTGFTSFDASAGGLGGCPYAPGAGGNLATDDLVYLLERSGFECGVDSIALAKASLPVLEVLGRSPASKAQSALLAACR
ncbi:MAG: hydroxymethylglutaryl-CoA lyase [Armatimonadetes bacterium]|nr:hydroxymethylglutaryl-CoA lyase [Armatimonadota bacterium]